MDEPTQRTEILLYRVILIEETGDLAEALNYLNRFESHVRAFVLGIMLNYICLLRTDS